MIHHTFLGDGGACGALMRALDWSGSPLGDPSTWPQSLRPVVGLLLTSRFPMFVAWGPELGFLYNEPYAEILGAKHPAAMGARFQDVWVEIWPDILPMIDAVLAGEATFHENLPLVMNRRGFDEQTWFTFSYSPVRDQSGAVAGMFCACTETTGQVLAEHALTAERDRAQGVLAGMAEGFTLVDRDFRILDLNAEAMRLETRPKEAIIGRTHWEAYPGSEGSELGRLYKRAMAERVSVSLEHLYRWEDGREAWIERRAYPVNQGLAVFYRDVSERRATEDALRATTARAETLAAEQVAILGQLAEGVIVTDPAGRITFVNEAAARIHGVARLDVEPDAYSETYHLLTVDGQPYPSHELPLARAVREGETVLDARWRIQRPDGSEVLAIGSAQPVLDTKGERIGAVLTLRDDTARDEAEAALAASEARLRFLDRLGAETAPLADADAVLTTTTRLLGEHLSASVCAYADMDEDQDGFTIRGDWARPGSRSIVGRYRLADFGKLAVKNLTAGLPLVVNDNLHELAPEEAATFQGIGIAATICMPLVKEGRLAALMAIHDRAPRAWTEAELSLLREVTERSWAHVERVAAVAELRDSESRYRTLFETVESGFCTVEVDEDGARGGAQGRIDYRVVEANLAFHAQTGFPPTILGQWLRTAEPTLEEHWYETYGRVARTGEPSRFEQGSDSLGRWFDVHAFRVGDPGEGRVAVLFNNISARRQAEVRLREFNDTLEAQVAARTAERDRMWETSPDLMVVIGFDGVFRRVNPAWTAILGYAPEELVGRHVNEFVLPDDHTKTTAAYEAAAEGGRPRVENRYRHKDGSVRWISWVAAPAGEVTYATGRDVTVEKERAAQLEAAQEQLRQSQKLEAMGSLTGGVAHDFNNLLTPIIGSLDRLLNRGVGDERERRLMAGALESAERAKTLVQRLLAFARRQPLQPVAVDVRGLVDGLAGLIGSTLGPKINVRVEVPEDLSPAKADPNQLEMALLNLAVNARDAMPEGGTLTIAASREGVRGQHRAGLKVGHYVRLSVTDTGLGMDEVTRERAVEPFFSTKGVGRGTGLGLSMVHGLASQLGGGLAIKSEPGQGTTVALWLPVSAAPVVEAGAGRTAAPTVASRGRALLVDDEVLVRMSTADMLADLGFDVVEAGSAEEALGLMHEGSAVDLLVTDHLMPGMSGAELAREVRMLRPGLPILIVSGYAEVDDLALDLPRLTKPFRVAELADRVATLMPEAAPLR